MGERKRILVADDDDELRGLLEFYLGKQGHETVCVADGRKALDAAVRGGFDLVMLDVMMPELDGYRVARELVDRLGASCPRILIMTCRDLEKEKGQLLMSGCHFSLQKPFKIKAVKEALARVFGPPAP